MKQILLIFWMLLGYHSFGQQQSIVVKLIYYNLDYHLIDDQTIIQTSLGKILNAEGAQELKQLNSRLPGIGNWRVTKIFPFLGTRDSVSISRLGERITVPPFWAVFRLEVPASEDVYRTIAILNELVGLFEYAHFDYEVDLQCTDSVPNDALYANRQESLFDPTGLADINVEEVWCIETGEPFITVGVHDTGIDTTHPDMRVGYGNGYYFDDLATLPVWGTDFEGHGTSVAGIIGARRNNGIGIAGIAGGDGTDTSGCTLVDVKMPFNFLGSPGMTISYLLAGVVDGARAIGSTWDYQTYVESDYNNDYYYTHSPGLGLHIGNHSYVLKTDIPTQIGGNRIIGEGILYIPSCDLCRETYLFSLRNGVINVVARGNSATISPETDPTIVDMQYPQSFPDNWIISVGASGYDGTTVRDGINQSVSEAPQDYWSLYGANMDIIAPGSDSIVYSTAPNNDNEPNMDYRPFNGTSAAAPHVTGVVALLLSHYNKDCYNQRNLSIEDVEYLLQESATDILDPNYDEVSGWGRLNAGEALKMIENPTKQIVHPDSLVSSTILARDTIALGYNKAFVADGWGPISQGFPLVRETEYEVERVLIENEYYFGDYILPTTQIVDFWVRPSASNSVGFYRDTIVNIVGLDIGGGTLIPTPKFNFDFYNQSPYDSIVSVDLLNNTIKVSGYFYHFIGRYNPIDENGFIELGDSIFVDLLTDIWLPIDPIMNIPEMAFSMYILDSTLTNIYDFSCTSEYLDFADSIFHSYNYLGVDELEPVGFTIFPNPTRTNLTIQLDKVASSELILYTVSGKEVMRREFQGKELTIATEDWATGMYFLFIRNEFGECMRKLIKE